MSKIPIHRMLRLVNFDQLYAANMPDAILLNQVDYTDREYAKKLSAKVFANGSDLDFVASCDCGETVGNYYIGTKCHHCGTEVQNDFSAEGRGLEHNLWIGIPEGVSGVLHPIVYNVLSNWLKVKNGKKGTNYIDVICDIDMDLPPTLEGVVDGRGHEYLYQNFDRLMDHFMTVDKVTRKYRHLEFVKMFLNKYRDIIFCTKLPILSKLLHATTPDSSSGRSYIDSSGQYVLAAIIDLARLKSAIYRSRPDHVHRVLQRMYKAVIGYYDDIGRRRLGKKLSLIRRHMFGTRLHWTFRNVIIPLTGIHRYDEIYMPWSTTVNLLKLHIIGRLVYQYGLDMSAAVSKHITALYNYDETIDAIMKNLIAESPGIGLPTIINRNPSIKRGACQLVYITKVKTDVNDHTFNISIMILKDQVGLAIW